MKFEQLQLPIVFRQLVTCSAAQPDDPHHHLRQKENGYWQMRVAIDRGPKLIGGRLTVGLETHDVEEARARRDVVLKALEQAALVAAPKWVRERVEPVTEEPAPVNPTDPRKWGELAGKG